MALTAVYPVVYNMLVTKPHRRVKFAIERWYKVANQVGKRYRCSKCGAEFIVTRGGDGTINCCGQPMELKQ